MTKRTDQIRVLLKGIESGDPAAVSVVNQSKYIQHNPQTHEGGEGLAALFKRISKTSPRVNIVRAFQDGDYVFAHTEYDFATRKIGFEVFRFEGEQVVEHWDNIQERKGPNSAGHTMVDGQIEVADTELTEANRELVRSFVRDVLIGQKMDLLPKYIETENYTEYSPEIGVSDKATSMNYEQTHRVLAAGNFVLTVSEGTNRGVHTSFYDLFRVAGAMIVEHWDTIEAIAPKSSWQNDNGKF
ncbi:MAG: hypothetical protein JKY56_07605 [Kofleriaceae bacterium]|nr:hypothetical protein [Kofleriaceae bacterium]